jgi:hypothetical protein
MTLALAEMIVAMMVPGLPVKSFPALPNIFFRYVTKHKTIWIFNEAPRKMSAVPSGIAIKSAA